MADQETLRRRGKPARGAITGGAGRVYLAPSGIHGKGVFAAARFRKGDTIGRFEGVPAKRNGPFVLWVEDEDGTVDARRGTNALRFVNHSREPNAEFDGWDLVALRAIPPDEEITVDYGDEAP